MPYNEVKYMTFYLEGRTHDKLLKHHLDTEDLVDLVLATNNKVFNAVIRDSCVEAAKKLETGKIKNAWLAEHDTEIKAAGGDGSAAYQAWVTGRIDELAYATEGEVIDAMNERVGGDRIDEDDDEEDEDEEDDDDYDPEDGEDGDK